MGTFQAGATPVGSDGGSSRRAGEAGGAGACGAGSSDRISEP
jgi:hypothetical protein